MPDPELPVQMFPRISDDCWQILNYLRRNNWESSALDLCLQVNPLGYRQRLSDLRCVYLIDAKPEPEHPRDGEVAIYRIAPELRPRAGWLLDHMTLEGFEATPVQKGLFS